MADIDFIDRKISGIGPVCQFLSRELMGGKKIGRYFWTRVDKTIGKSRLQLFIDAGLVVNVLGVPVLETGKFFEKIKNDPGLFEIFNVTISRTGILTKEKPFLNLTGFKLIDQWARDFMEQVEAATFLDTADCAVELNKLGELLHGLTYDARMIKMRMSEPEEGKTHKKRGRPRKSD